MILSISDIAKIIKENPHKELIAAAQKQAKELRMHTTGDGLKDEISKISNHEDEDLRDIRKKYARSNKDLFSRLLRPVDKVFSARGGSVYYNLSDETNRQAMQLTANLKNGMSVRKWLETRWRQHMIDDPAGLLFIEVGDVVNGRPQVYPTYKASTTIFDYKPNGTDLHYVIFEVSNDEKKSKGVPVEDKVYRVVDAAMDYWVKFTSEQTTILPDHSYPNIFGHVPAITNSDFESPINEGLRISLVSDVVELASDFLQTGSIRNLAKVRMAYPKYWEFADSCGDCQGTGFKEGKKCETCKGTGKKIMLKPGEAKLLEYPDRDGVNVAPSVAGFVTFPKEYFDNATQELQMLEAMCYETLWGTGTPGQAKGPDSPGSMTATEALIDLQPMQDRLQQISEMAERRHKFIVDHIIRGAINPGYVGASVNYGRRYTIESPDAIWTRYQEARKAGAAISILDDLLMEHVETKYSGDPVSMMIQVKLLSVEPFVHYTIDEVKGMSVRPEEYARKLYFGEWLQSVSEAELISRSADELKALLATYAADRQGEKEGQLLAVTIGVGGIQGMVQILTAQGIASEAKKAALEIVFGLKPEDADRLSVSDPAPGMTA